MKPEPIPTSSRRTLDFDLETVAAGFADPEWVPQTVTAWAACWTDENEVRVEALPPASFYDLPARRRFLEPLAALIGEAGVVTGHNVCMVPSTRILTSDLRWVPAGDLAVGDGLLAFEEHPSGARRRMQFATVVGNRLDRDEVFAVELETGEILHATADHPWLVGTQSAPGAKHRWRRTDELLGAPPKRNGGFPKSPALLYRVLEPWSQDASWGCGWLSGFFDGEGTLAGKNAAKAQIVAAQNPGPEHDRCMALLAERGFPAVSSPSRGATDVAQRVCERIRINGGLQQKFRFLGQIRPARLLANWSAMDPGALRAMESVRVVDVTSVGHREVARLATSSGTYIAEGYAVHNCRFDLPVLNADLMRVGLSPLEPVMVQDTIRLPKSKGFKKGQDVLSAVLGVEAEKLPLHWGAWAAAYADDSLATVKARVVGDVRQHMQLRERMREQGWLMTPKMWRSS